jgi:DNA-binding PadR family transcriptional regulator
MSNSPKLSPEQVLPLKPADFHILLVLSKEDLHGYGIMREVEAESEGRVRLEVGSMYRLIARMMDEGLIADAGRENHDRRRYYRITEFGKQAARLEARRLADVVSVARRYNLLGGGDGS